MPCCVNSTPAKAKCWHLPTNSASCIADCMEFEFHYNLQKVASEICHWFHCDHYESNRSFMSAMLAFLRRCLNLGKHHFTIRFKSSHSRFCPSRRPMAQTTFEIRPHQDLDMGSSGVLPSTIYTTAFDKTIIEPPVNPSRPTVSNAIPLLSRKPRLKHSSVTQMENENLRVHFSDQAERETIRLEDGRIPLRDSASTSSRLTEILTSFPTPPLKPSVPIPPMVSTSKSTPDARLVSDCTPPPLNGLDPFQPMPLVGAREMVPQGCTGVSSISFPSVSRRTTPHEHGNSRAVPEIRVTSSSIHSSSPRVSGRTAQGGKSIDSSLLHVPNRRVQGRKLTKRIIHKTKPDMTHVGRVATSARQTRATVTVSPMSTALSPSTPTRSLLRKKPPKTMSSPSTSTLVSSPVFTRTPRRAPRPPPMGLFPGSSSDRIQYDKCSGYSYTFQEGKSGSGWGRLRMI